MTVILEDDKYVCHRCDSCGIHRHGSYRIERGLNGRIRSALDILPTGWQRKQRLHLCGKCKRHHVLPVQVGILSDVSRR